MRYVLSFAKVHGTQQYLFSTVNPSNHTAKFNHTTISAMTDNREQIYTMVMYGMIVWLVNDNIRYRSFHEVVHASANDNAKPLLSYYCMG